MRLSRTGAQRTLDALAAGRAPGVREHRVVCVVPLYVEEELAAETVAFWVSVAEQKLCDQVLLVTTVKEEPRQGGRSTHEVCERELERLGADPERIALLHCQEVTRFRASQLNLAVEHARARFLPEVENSSRLWIGVYNADSRPQHETFAELDERVADDGTTRLFQQLVDYVVPERGRAGSVAVGNAVLQTWWTWSHYVARNRRGRPGGTVWSRTAPYSTFGHGEFARLDFLDHIGLFPDFAYADGLLLGWIARLAGEPIGLLASRDVAEVPRRARDLLTQQTAWLRGLLNFDATARWCREQGVLRLSPLEVRFLRAQHLAIPVGWGLSTVALAASGAAVARRARRGEAAAHDLAVVAALVSYPVTPALVSTAASLRGVPLSRRVRGVLASWPLEGLAFWPALLSHLGRNQRAPAKTPR